MTSTPAAMPTPRVPNAAEAARGSGTASSAHRITGNVPITVRNIRTPHLPDSVGDEIVSPAVLPLALARTYAARIHAGEAPISLTVDQGNVAVDPAIFSLSAWPGPTQLQIQNELTRLSSAVVTLDNGTEVSLSMVVRALDSACKLSSSSRNYIIILDAMRPQFGNPMINFTSERQQLEVLKLIIEDPSTLMSFAHAIYELYGNYRHDDAKIIKELFALVYSE